MKKILILFVSIVILSCSSDDDEVDERYLAKVEEYNFELSSDPDDRIQIEGHWYSKLYVHLTIVNETNNDMNGRFNFWTEVDDKYGHGQGTPFQTKRFHIPASDTIELNYKTEEWFASAFTDQNFVAIEFERYD